MTICTFLGAVGFAWLSFVLNRTAVGPARGLDNELVHESKGAVLCVPQVLLKSVPGLEEPSPRVVSAFQCAPTMSDAARSNVVASIISFRNRD